MATTYTLNDDTTLPRVGFGTWPLRGDEGIDAIVSAIRVGYRLIDSRTKCNARELLLRQRRNSGHTATTDAEAARLRIQQ